MTPGDVTRRRRRRRTATTVGVTRAGWMLGLGSIASVAGGRLFGVIELNVVGLAGALLLVVAAAGSGRRPRLSAARVPAAVVVTAGDPLDVEVRVTAGARTSRAVMLTDQIGGRRVARLLVPPLAAGATSIDRFRLDGLTRGRLVLGPLVARTDDPFGLTTGETVIGNEREVWVLPRVIALTAPRLAAPTSSRQVGVAATRPAGPGELTGLRPYAPGDDLRRVHWRASARSNDLVVREDAGAGSGDVVVVLDTDARHYADEAEFEWAVEAAASIVEAWRVDRRRVRLIAGEHDSGDRATGGGTRPLLRVLAEVTRDQVPLTSGLARAQRPPAHLVVVTGRPGPGDRTAIERTDPAVVVAATPAGWRRPTALLGPDLRSTWDTALQRLEASVERGQRRGVRS